MLQIMGFWAAEGICLDINLENYSPVLTRYCTSYDKIAIILVNYIDI